MAFNSKTAKLAGSKSKRGKAKTTMELQTSFNIIIANNLENLDKWVKEVARKDPAKAMDLILKLSSFILPKARTVEVDIKERKEDLTTLTDEELSERLHQANRVLYDNYDPKTRTFKN